ncbi:ubiquinone biosynthesis protein COQ9-B, mitochondrial-like [Rhopilema esculentum]|uniref:ubiquinone biosynthesis protein COQ9-B, mitochondrial-like n=1 Tax=Rhopilema esculentum TaxID=499914 RepID=UPI0031D9176E
MAALNTGLRTTIGRSYGLLRRGLFGSAIVSKKKKDPIDSHVLGDDNKDFGDIVRDDEVKAAEGEEVPEITSSASANKSDDQDLGDIVRDDTVKTIQIDGDISSTNSTEKINFAKEATKDMHSSTSFSIDDMLLRSATDSTNENEDAEDSDEEYYYYDSEDDMKRQILNSALEFVPEYGWSDFAIQKGAEAEGLSSSIEGLFTKGPGDLVLHFIDECNGRLAEQLSEKSKLNEEAPGAAAIPKRSTTDFLQEALMVRLLMLRPYIHTWPEAIRLLMRPENAQSATESLAHMVDEVWYHAGDTSTDFNWYTKRGALAAIYGASELYMTQDRSVNFEDTREFVKNRLENANQLKQATLAMEDAVNAACSGMSVVLSTAQNILGYNCRRR